MREFVHNERASSSVEQQITEMRRQLLSIGEMERVLTERNAGRELYRYLLEAHKSLAREKLPERHTLEFQQIAELQLNQLAFQEPRPS